VTPEDNELLTRVGPGTPMGPLLRRYWLPLLESETLGPPDGGPRRMPREDADHAGERLVLLEEDSASSEGCENRVSRPHGPEAISAA
jgi:hypothetical protein